MSLQMSYQKKRVFKWVLGIHLVLVFCSLIPHCIRRKPKKPAVFVEVISEPGPSVVEPILPTIEPEPEPEPAPEPEPDPAPVPEPKPRPTIKPKPKPKPEPKKPEKPKWEPKKVIRQNKRINRTPTKPKTVTPQRKRITSSDIQKALGTPTGSYDAESAYYNTIQSRFYSVWLQPSSAPYGTRATATIKVSANGTITFRSLTVISGNGDFDRSVNTALRALSSLPPPPSSLANRSITITFELD